MLRFRAAGIFSRRAEIESAYGFYNDNVASGMQFGVQVRCGVFVKVGYVAYSPCPASLNYREKKMADFVFFVACSLKQLEEQCGLALLKEL